MKENDNSLILKIKNKAQLDKIDKEIRESENSDVVVSAIKDGTLLLLYQQFLPQ